jgi:D-serine deaminase-like pyridoxal phosphate-dependent protein
MDLRDLSTPALVLDRRRLLANVAAMTARARALGVNLRPHCKTAKSAAVAKLATQGNAGGITVSTLREAEYFFERGIRDILYGVGIAPNKLDRAAALAARGADLKIVTDNVTAARAIAGYGAPHKVLIEVDSGDRRGGVAPDSKDLLDVARTLAATNTVTVMGVMTHAGQSYDGRDPEAMARIAEEERAAAVAAAGRLRELGLDCPIVSVGSTPTATFARDLSGATEMRPGVYVFYDLYQAGIGVCTIDDIALSVLATVIGHRPGDNVILIDAGALALSKDRSTEKLGRNGDCGFGLVCDAATLEPIPGLKVAAVSQEHGRVTSDRPLPFDRLPVGSPLRILPNHACITAAGYDAYQIVDGSTEVVDRWGRCNGW